MFVKPLSELTDSELLDILDTVSSEVKKRNSLVGSDDDQEAIKRAAEYFASLVTGQHR